MTTGGDAESDYYSGEYLQDILEAGLLEVGGQQLLDDAHHEAAGHVDRHHPWNGHGDEPGERVSAYCAVLWQRLEHARTDIDEQPLVGNGDEPSDPAPRQ